MTDIICPFCGRESRSEDHCTRCHTRFTKEIRAAAFRADNDPRSDRLGPFSTKTAKRLALAFIVLVLVAFVVATELSGNGVSGYGR